MKKVILTVALIVGTSIAYTGEGKKVIIVEQMSTEQVVFDIALNEKNELLVHLSGIHQEMASLSLTTLRGSTIHYEFIEQSEKDCKINLDNLEKGKYYVKLNLNGEIRMKSILIK